MQAKKKTSFFPPEWLENSNSLCSDHLYVRVYITTPEGIGVEIYWMEIIDIAFAPPFVSGKLRVRKTNKSSWNVDTARHIIVKRIGIRDKTSLLLLAIRSMFTIIFVTDVWAAVNKSRMRVFSPFYLRTRVEFHRSPFKVSGKGNFGEWIHGCAPARTPLNISTVMRHRTDDGHCRRSSNHVFGQC